MAPPPSALARPSRRARFLPVGGCVPHAPIPEERALRAARPTHPPRISFSVGGAAPHAPVGHGARGAGSRAAARLVCGRLRPSRSPPGTAHAARIRGQPRVLSGGGCAPHAPRRARRTRRGFEGSRASCPREAAPLTLPAGHGARGADSRAAARLVRGRLRPSRSPSGTAHAARVRGQPRVLSAGGCAPHAPRRSGARAAGWGARPPFSARERATVMVRPLQN